MTASICSSTSMYIHSSDGGVDDFVTSAVLFAAQKSKTAVILTDADSEPVSAYSALHKTAQLFNPSAPIGMSPSQTWNAFPWVWRMESSDVNEMPILRRFEDASPEQDGNKLFAKLLNASEKVKIIATGPLTTIADVLTANPHLAAKIEELHWMGGAVNVPGNILNSPEISPKKLNAFAEWNVFADPAAAEWVFKNTEFPIHLYPLDISGQTVPNDFVEILRERPRTVYTKYTLQCYDIVANSPEYKMWDVVAVAGALCPEVFEPPVREKLNVVTAGDKEGALVKDPQGRLVKVYQQFKDNDPANFYTAIADLLS